MSVTPEDLEAGLRVAWALPLGSGAAFLTTLGLIGNSPNPDAAFEGLWPCLACWGLGSVLGTMAVIYFLGAANAYDDVKKASAARRVHPDVKRLSLYLVASILLMASGLILLLTVHARGYTLGGSW
jgi:hypothetical protein